MTTTTWTNPAGGDFNTASNWNSGVPGPGETALITASGTYTVTSSQLNTIATLEMAKKATLEIEGSAFRLTSGTGTGALAGTITVTLNGAAEPGVLQLGATSASTIFKNSGTIELLLAADIVVAGTATLIDDGKIVLDGADTIIGTGAFNGTLNNGSTSSRHTISGTGTIGDGSLTFVNAAKGIIDANGASDTFASQNLDVDTASFTNSGLMEATGTGVLFLQSDVDQSASGKMKTLASTTTSTGAEIALNNASIVNGSVSIAKGTSLQSVVGGTDEINTTTPIANAGTIQAVDTSTLILSAVKNTATGDLTAGANSRIEVAETETGGTANIDAGGEIFFAGPASAKVTFDGNGVLILNDATKFTGSVAGLSSNLGAAIALDNIPFADGPIVNPSAHMFTVTDPVTGIVDKINFVGSGNFIAHDGTGALAGTTLISDPPIGSASVADTSLLAQSMASIGASGGLAGSGSGGVPGNHGSSDFLTANSLHLHHG